MLVEAVQKGNLPARIFARIQAKPDLVWTPVDFLDLAGRTAVDKALQRLVNHKKLRRIERGFYDCPRVNPLTNRSSVPDYRAVIDAVARRDQARMVIDGMTAANELGFTTAVPARIEVLADARLRPIRLGAQEIRFKEAAPSRLYWAGHPAMRVVQALHWLQDVLQNGDERGKISEQLRQLLGDPVHGPALRQDLHKGLHTLPTWMQDVIRPLIQETSSP